MDLLAPVFATAWFEHLAIFSVVFVVIMIAIFVFGLAYEQWNYVNENLGWIEFMFYIVIFMWWGSMVWGWLMEYLS